MFFAGGSTCSSNRHKFLFYLFVEQILLSHRTDTSFPRKPYFSNTYKFSGSLYFFIEQIYHYNLKIYILVILSYRTGKTGQNRYFKLFREICARKTFAKFANSVSFEESLSRKIFSKMIIRESLSREILLKFIVCERFFQILNTLKEEIFAAI